MKSMLAGTSGRALVLALSGLPLQATMPAAVFSLTDAESGRIDADGRYSESGGVVSPAPSVPGSAPIPVPEPSAVFMLLGALAVFFLLKRGAGRR